MTMLSRIMLVAAAALSVAGSPVMVSSVEAQDDWAWSGAISAGRTLEIKGVNGGINAVAASGSEAVVRVTREGRRNDPADVRMVVIEHDRGVTICAIYPDQPGRSPNECAPGDEGRNNVQNNDVSVRWEIQVPAGVDFVARTVNGSISARDVRSNTVARTVNGNVNVTTYGIARATTVNGSINVTLDAADWRDDLDFQTTNGSVTVAISGDLNAQVSAQTVNGRIETDFPLQVIGRLTSRRLNGTAGAGGPGLSIKTVNGSIRLVRQ